MYNPTTWVQVLMDVNLGSYLKASLTVFLQDKSLPCPCYITCIIFLNTWTNKSPWLNFYSCLLALGDVEEAQKGFEICLKSNHAASLNHKIIEEASDGLQKAQVTWSVVLCCH